ncbi:MAG TPA: helix-turn-helix domain-containing protein [Mycobacteriales bacterium]|nr:helix-turn-helix domain-containing protein [Mycobacteriales bacterium]
MPGSGEATLYRRVLRGVPRLARDMVAHFVAEIPVYAALPREVLDGEITAITAANLRIFLGTLREDRGPTDDELHEVRLSAARRAEERVPLEALLTAYHIGGRLLWSEFVRAATPAETPVLLATVERILRYVQTVTAAVATSYLEERQAIYGEERDAHRSLAQALLTGGPAETVASRLELPIASSYVVLALAIAEHPDEAAGGVGGSVAGRRKLRRVQDVLDGFGGDRALGLLDATGGTILLASGPAELDDDAVRLPVLLGALGQAAGAPVIGGASLARERRDLVAAGQQARDVLRLALRLGRGPGVYFLRDVLLEYQLTRHSDALPLLAELLGPLDRNPDLGRTIEAYLACDLDRRTSAAELHVHPNTLDYRLRRIVELTGLDPATTVGLQLLAAGLAARRLRIGP